MNTTSREAFIALAKNNEWIKKCGVDLKLGKDGEYPFYYDEANTLYSMHLAALSVDKDGEAVARDVTAVYLHEIIEPDGTNNRLLSFSQKNPWSHWLETHRAQCNYKITTFTHPSPPNQQVRDAYERAAQIAELALGADGSLGKIAGIPQAIRALIPSEPAIGEQK